MKTQIEAKPPIIGLFKGEQNDEKINADVEQLIAFYRGLGFFRVRVSRQQHTNGNEERPRLTFVIDEGPRYRTGGFRFVGNQKFTSEQLGEAVKLKVGDYYARRNVDRDLKRLSDLYSAEGYRSASVQAELEFDDESSTVTVVFSIKEADFFSSLFGVAR
ncbi:MAG TPA: POTRA domain-containing protein [Pirellulales bacterium]|nr:POTRA domain-containing protein [Pirellulales bacterium]